jgi:divalent metal cation (Fe/Co/Zn/Cd) transporter
VFPRSRVPALTRRLVNLALVFVKATAGILLHSSSLLADAGHSAADILSDILTLSTITFSQREPNLRYPLGYGKVETLGAIGVSSLLCIVPGVLLM